MGYEARLVVGNKQRSLLTFRVRYFEGRSSTVFNWSENACLGEDTLDSLQEVISQDHHGFRPKPGLPYGGLFEITMESSSDDDFFYDWFTPSKKFGTPIKNGVIEFYDDGEDQVPFKRMEFWDGWVTDISETMSSTGRKPMIIQLRISAATVRYNKSLVVQKNWFQTQVIAQQGISPLSKAAISNVAPVAAVASVGNVTKTVASNAGSKNLLKSLGQSLEKKAGSLADSLSKTAVKSLEKEGTVEKIVEWVVEKVEDIVKEKETDYGIFLTEKGEFLRDTTKDAGNSAFYILDNRGELKAAHLFERNVFAKDTEDIYGKIEGSTYEFYDIEKFSDAKELFEFLADNTTVEWSVMQFKGDINIITTSHEEGDRGAELYLIENYNIELFKHFHNHLRSWETYPSGMLVAFHMEQFGKGDIKFAKNHTDRAMKQGWVIPKFSIYMPKEARDEMSDPYIPYKATSKPENFKPFNNNK